MRRPPGPDDAALTGDPAFAKVGAGGAMSFRKDFQDFILRGNVVDLAVGVMIGAAFGKIVAATVDDLIMPLVSIILPEGGWRSYAVELGPKVKLQVGHLLGVVIDFVITAAVLFMVLVKFVGRLRLKAPAAAPVSTKVCTECLEAIPTAARRCKYCTSQAI
jgi:large conductance mechanosensitive channel